MSNENRFCMRCIIKSALGISFTSFVTLTQTKFKLAVFFLGRKCSCDITIWVWLDKIVGRKSASETLVICHFLFSSAPFSCTNVSFHTLTRLCYALYFALNAIHAFASSPSPSPSTGRKSNVTQRQAQVDKVIRRWGNLYTFIDRYFAKINIKMNENQWLGTGAYVRAFAPCEQDGWWSHNKHASWIKMWMLRGAQSERARDKKEELFVLLFVCEWV